MIPLVDIDHVVLRTADAPAMVRFYTAVLGCTVERDRADIGLVQLRAGNSLIDIVPVDGELGRHGGPAPGADGHNMDHFCLRVRPFEAAAIGAHLDAHGVEHGEPVERYGADGEGPSIYLTDPDGNTVELKGPARPGTRRGPSNPVQDQP